MTGIRVETDQQITWPKRDAALTYRANSSTNGKLKNPTSCPTPLLFWRGIRPLLADLPKASQSAAPRPFVGVAPQSFFLVLRAYPVAGKNPDVQVFGEKKIHFPADVSVYWGYWIDAGRDLKVASTFCGTSGENNCAGGV